MNGLSQLDRDNIARYEKKNLTTCRHFNGIQNTACKAGVVYKSVRGEPRGFPCFTDEEGGKPCALLSVMAPDEARADAEQWYELAMSRHKLMKVARADMMDEHKKSGANHGTVTCPKCGGRLRWSRASSNGHIHAQCLTAECLSWME